MKCKKVILHVAIVYYFCCVTLNNIVLAQQDRAPHGVPPNQHQQQPPSDGEGEIKFHEPTEFAEAGGVPQQQVNQQQLNQQQPNQPQQAQEEIRQPQVQPHAPHPHEAHGHGIGESLDADHMKQHEKDVYVDFSKMTQPQIIMHHFRQFDQNKDGTVDGLEMFKKMQRDNDEHLDGVLTSEQLIIDMNRFAETVDSALKLYDENNDGLIYYGEFYRAHMNLNEKGD